MAFVIIFSSGIGQVNDYRKGPVLGINFFFNDFQTASSIRSTSLGIAIRNKKLGKIKDMSPGIAINYMEGLSNYIDFSATLSGSFVDYPFEGRVSTGNEALLLEGDASLHAKLLPDKYWVVPFFSAGVGASKFKGYYGAFIPVGGGIQVNFFDDAFLLINTQYRLKVSENTNYHFYGSIGIAGNIGSKKKAQTPGQ